MVSFAPPVRTLAPARVRFRAGVPFVHDMAAVGALLLLTAVMAWPLVVGATMVGQDTAAFFYPIFAALAERLRAGDIPGWNPSQFSGVPFTADPESGWLYLPAMLLFGLLPLAAAAKAWMLVHLLLAGLGTYALGRTLRLGALGALTAAVAYEFSGLMSARAVCCPAYAQVASWMPTVLLGTELAVGARTWVHRAAWWGVAGLALSQIFVAWLGQGAYYALVAFGAYVAYRTLIVPPDASSPRARIGALALHGATPVLIGLVLAAGAIWPRLTYVPRTNLAEGYVGDLAWAANLGGWDPPVTVGQLLGRSLYYAGGITLALAVVALLLARGRHAAPYFAALAVGAVVLAQRETTWLHRPLYALLPRFEELHRHYPERDMVVFFLGPALLAGASIDALARRPRWRRLLAAVAFAPPLIALWIEDRLAPIDTVAMRGAFAVAVGLLLAAALPWTARRFVAPALIGLLFVELLAAGRFIQQRGPYGGFHRVDLEAYFAPPPVVDFLRDRETDDGAPSRFFGYDPGIHPGDGTPPLYRYLFPDPRTAVLLLNNRATLFGLEDVQGYNPIQPRRYVEYLRALNGFPQEYHEGNIYWSGLDSPLLDLLNARYVLVPATIPPGRADLERLVQTLPTVYADGAVRVLENREALPRAWIVHEALTIARGEALPLLTSGTIDPRRVALIEQAPPPLAPADDSAVDRAEVTRHDPDLIRVATETDAPGLLVLSETFDPDWRAEVDGEPVPILTANHIQRAVPIPAGAHTVELRYAPISLRLGTAVSAAGYCALVAMWGLAAWRSTGRGRRSEA